MRWSYIINGKEKISLSEGGCRFLESEITSVETRTTEQEITGRDGVLIGDNTFGPFELVLKFYYEGIDNNDLLLFAEKIKKIIHARNAMYVVHSQMPGRKYAFNSAKIGDFETVTSSDATFTITFNCFKGYSESLFSTDRLDLMSEHWDFFNGLTVDEDIKYSHSTNDFKIYNGSSDTITPIQSHYIKIKMNIDAPNGFKLRNNTNGTEFEYKKAIKAKDNLVLNGAHPFLNGKNCGIDTNWEFLTLDPGMNKFEIIGDGAQVKNITFSFNFIYR